ncbi:flagellar basal body-associated FliL family protein [Paenibacillus sabinae]|uniref:Lipoprotein n=1 Tax=Paenibacillus sabinae T27 TaxID=1268072 RepID=X4ZY45_9BACL|nr:flagellar basal body-associated FliL family protein [Paenibacillus sabinae]AHV97118.1 hypothetical protein PSAB_10950 [Paenibacillus sabinae T27]
MMISQAKRAAVLLAILCGLTGGCGVMDGKPAGEMLNLALAGLTGTDGVTFEGQAALLVDGRQLPEGSVYYGGEMNHHSTLRLYTLLPDSANTRGVLTEQSARANLYSRLEKRNGAWQVLPESDERSVNPLPGLNPIRQLEELKSMSKMVTNEDGAGRGMRLLRIELAPQQAQDQLAAELKAEMEAIRAAYSRLPDLRAGTGAELSKLETLWSKENGELERRLNNAAVETVYHVKVDARRNLPKSMSRQRTITYMTTKGQTRRETYVSRVDFYGYR